MFIRALPFHYVLIRATLLAALALCVPACGSGDSEPKVVETGADPGDGSDSDPADGDDGTGSEPGDQPDDSGDDDAGSELALGIWPIGGSTTPDCIQDGFGHRELGGNDDFHPGMDTCDDNERDLADEADPNADESGFDVLAPLGGTISRVRLWDPLWNNEDADTGNDCPSFCRQGNFVMIEHPELSGRFGGQTVQSIYMHLAMDSIPASIEVGNAINPGEKIGNVGRTGFDINTTHLHFGLLVGSESGLIDFDDYINPLHVLPYPAPPTPHAIEARLETDASVFDVDECTTAAGEFPVLSVKITQVAPALDVSRIALQAGNGSGEAMVLDIDGRIGVGHDGEDEEPDTEPDDFEQGCIAVTAAPFNEDEQNYVLTVRFGGDWTSGESYDVTLTNVRGETRTESIVVE